MQKLKKLIFAFGISVIFLGNVGAAKCDNAEQAKLNSLVANVKATYEEAEGILDPDLYTIPDALLGTDEEETYEAKYSYLKVSIINITEEFYVEVTNDVTKDRLVYNYGDTDKGTVTFDWKNLSEVVTFTIKIYSSNKTGCSGETQKTLRLTLPRMNDYYGYDICNGIEEYSLCQKFVTFDPVSLDTFMSRIETYLKNRENGINGKDEVEDEGFFEKVGNFIGEHKVAFIIGGVVLLISAGVVVAVIVKRRRSSDL